MGIDLELPPLNLRGASRELSQEEMELYKWKDTLSAVKQSEINLLNLYLRKVRLVKLRKFIDEALAKMKRPTCRGNKEQDTNNKDQGTSPDKRKKELLDLAKKKGNEYSKMNRFHDRDYHIYQPKKYSSRENITNYEGYVYSRQYGNMVSERNLSKSQAKKSKGLNRSDSNLSTGSGAWSKKRHQIEYGNYTSMRNKLLRKEAQGQFDEEYSELLLKCVNFERDHLQVQGYLEKKLLAHPNLVNNYKSMIQGLISQHSESSMEGVPLEEVFDNTETSLQGQGANEKNCVSEEQSESVINCYSYDNESQQENTYEVIEQEESVLKFELEQISETIIRNGDFEKVVSDIVDRYESNRRIGDRPQNLLTDLYLAYTLNLMKTAEAKKFIEGKIDMSGIKNQIIDQSSNLSLVLSQVLRCEEN